MTALNWTPTEKAYLRYLRRFVTMARTIPVSHYDLHVIYLLGRVDIADFLRKPVPKPPRTMSDTVRKEAQNIYRELKALRFQADTHDAPLMRLAYLQGRAEEALRTARLEKLAKQRE